MSAYDVPEHMQAQVLEAYNGPYVFTTVPVPKLTTGNDILVRVAAAGFCHTDAVLAQGGLKPQPPSFPHIGCHEFAGTVVAVSDSPSEAAQACPVGTRVGCPGRGWHACGSCFECKDPNNDYVGFSMYCADAGFASSGISKHGGFAEYAVVDARQIAPLPDDLQFVDAAPLMCAGVTIYNALKRCNLSPGQRVGIIGCGGGLGHLGLQYADAMGLRTTGVDAADGPLKLANSLGTTAQIVDARTTTADDLVIAIGKEDDKKHRAEMGLDAVIVLPESQASFDYGTKLLRNHGLCIVVSFAEEGFRVFGKELVYRDIRVHGTMLGTNASLREIVALAAEHNIRPVTKAFSLERLNDLVAEYDKGEGGRLVVDMSL